MPEQKSDPRLPTVEQELQVVQAGESLLQKTKGVARRINTNVWRIVRRDYRPEAELPGPAERP